MRPLYVSLYQFADDSSRAHNPFVALGLLLGEVLSSSAVALFNLSIIKALGERPTMLTTRQMATLRAALRFWSEEMHTPELMRPYYDTRKQVPLSRTELATLRKQLLDQQLRYAGFDEFTGRLSSTVLYAGAEQARSEIQATHIVTVLLPPA